MPSAARLLPAVIAVVLTTTLVGGGVAAADLRADERRVEAERERVAAAERLAREEEAYRATVRALAEELYDQVQPLQETADRVVRVEDGSFTVLSDVTTKGGGAKGLADLRGRLTAVVPPPTLAESHRSLDAGLEQLTRGADALMSSVDPDLDAPAFFREFSRGDEALDKGVRIVNGELGTLFGLQVPSLPSEEGTPRATRRPAGKAAYLSAVGGLCAVTPPDTPDDAAGLRRDAGHLRGMLDGLIAVPAPPADAELLRGTVVEPLERSRAVPDGLEAVAGAIDRRDRRAFVAAQLSLERGSLELEQVGKGFRDYGSQTCTIAFVGDGQGEGEGGAKGDAPAERPA